MGRKRAFVTGAGMGIGYGIALEFAKAGYDVAIHHSPSSAESAKELCAKMEGYGAKTLAIQGDLFKESTVHEMFAKVEETFGGIDVFVNNAGITVGGTLLDVTEDTWDKAFLLNVKAATFCIQAAGRMMVKQHVPGDIIVILSNQIDYVGMHTSIYPATKVALKKVVQAAAVEFIPFGIHVNGIAPGYVDTGAARMGKKEPTYDGIPARRWVSLEEMGQIALFLCGPYADSFVGHIMHVDGGATLYSGGPRLWEYGEKLQARVDAADTDEERFGAIPAERERKAMEHKWESVIGSDNNKK